MARILVCGGAGFIGSNLCARLLNLGNTVICLDNFSTGRRQNLASCLGNPGFSIIEHDVVEHLDLVVDQIFNLACPASPPAYQSDPLKTFRTSVWGVWNLLALAQKNDAIILQASTSEVYGDPHVHPQPEEYWGHVNPVGIRSCYDEGKRGAETLLMDFHRAHATRIKIVRIFNTYGPGMDPEDGRVVSNFIVQSLRGESLTVYGNGDQTRSFCYVDDLVGGLVAMMNSPDHVTGPINLGNPTEFTVMELARMIQETTKSQLGIVHLPAPLDDPKQRKPDISKAERLLGWKPSVQLRAGIDRTIDYFRKEVTPKESTK